MKAIWSLILRDIRHAWTGGGLWLPVVFYLAVATLFPFAVGPDHALLARTGGGILWIAALLSSLLPIERLILPDMEKRNDRSIVDPGMVRRMDLCRQNCRAFHRLWRTTAARNPGCRRADRRTRYTNIRAVHGAGVRPARARWTGGHNRGADRRASRRFSIGRTFAGALAIPLLIFGAGTLDDNRVARCSCWPRPASQ